MGDTLETAVAAAPAAETTTDTNASLPESAVEGSQAKTTFTVIHSPAPTEATPDSQSDVIKVGDTAPGVPEKVSAVDQSITSPSPATTEKEVVDVVEVRVPTIDDDQTANAALSDQVNIAHYLFLRMPYSLLPPLLPANFSLPC